MQEKGKRALPPPAGSKLLSRRALKMMNDRHDEIPPTLTFRFSLPVCSAYTFSLKPATLAFTLLFSEPVYIDFVSRSYRPLEVVYGVGVSPED